MIGREIFEAPTGNERQIIADVPEPEACRIDQMGPEIWQDAGALIAPL
jgi:hypothetical protein